MTQPSAQPMTQHLTQPKTEHLEFAGLDIAFDDRVLRPRPWTVHQSRWATDLLTELPSGPVLELCCGAGQIGLAAVAGTTRRLVCVDLNPAAIGYTELNARAAGLANEVETRFGRITEALGAAERFPLVIADPPWVESAETDRFPEDPLSAIDGGVDGLAVARQCLEAIEAHLDAQGAALLQLGSVEQVAALMSLGSGALRCLEVRRFEGGAVAHLARADDDPRT